MSKVGVIAVYRPKPGAEERFENLLKNHYPVLRAQGLVSEKSPTYLRTEGGFILEILEWKDEASAAKAHESPAVQEIWRAAAELAEFKALGDTDVAQIPFAHLEKLELPPGGAAERTFSDTMISAKDYQGLIGFYEEYLGLELKLKSEAFALLEDPSSGQKLCITRAESITRPGPGIEVKDLDLALADLKARGGTVVKTWSFELMDGANALDPEGNELLIWKSKGD